MKKILLAVSVIALFAACGGGGETATKADSAKVSSMLINQGFLKASSIKENSVNVASTTTSTETCSKGGTMKYEIKTSEGDLMSQATACQSNTTTCRIDYLFSVTADKCIETVSGHVDAVGSTPARDCAFDITATGTFDFHLKIAATSTTASILVVYDGLMDFSGTNFNSNKTLHCEVKATIAVSASSTSTTVEDTATLCGTVCNVDYGACASDGTGTKKLSDFLTENSESLCTTTAATTELL